MNSRYTRSSRGPRASSAGLSVLALAGALASGFPRSTPAQLAGGSYWLVGQTTGGGGRSEGPSWSVSGSIAVPVCAVSRGGAYELNGGLVGTYPVSPERAAVWLARADAPSLQVTLTGVL